MRKCQQIKRSTSKKEEKTKGEFLDRELYDHDTDPMENNNLANDVQYKQTVDKLSHQLETGWRGAKPKAITTNITMQEPMMRPVSIYQSSHRGADE